MFGNSETQAVDRGYIDRRRKLRELLYTVEVPRPEGIGVWRQLDEFHAWARARCGLDGYATTSREEPGSWPRRTFLRVHFRAEPDAQAFAAAFGLPYAFEMSPAQTLTLPLADHHAIMPG